MSRISNSGVQNPTPSNTLHSRWRRAKRFARASRKPRLSARRARNSPGSSSKRSSNPACSSTKGLPLETQAAFAARQQLANLLQGIPLSIWYDWKNDGSDPNENEHNFGTVLPDLTPKPAYTAIKTLTRELSGYRIVRRLTLESDKDYALVCQTASGGQKLAAWTTGEAHLATLDLGLKDAKVFGGVTGNGERFTPKVTDGKLVLE